MAGRPEVTEALTAIEDDWGEAMFATNVVFEPLLGELFRSGLVMQAAPGNGDFVTPTVMGAGGVRLRPARPADEGLLRPAARPGVRRHNKQPHGWLLSAWVPRALRAARTMQPLWSQPDHWPPRFEDSLDHAKKRFAGIVSDLGLDPRRSWPSDHHRSPRVRRRQRHIVRNVRHHADERPGGGGRRRGHEHQAGRDGDLPAVDDPVDAVQRMDFDYDELEALGEEPGFFGANVLEESMSTHYGRMVHEDDRTIMFANPEDAAEYLGFDLPATVSADGPAAKASSEDSAWGRRAGARPTRRPPRPGGSARPVPPAQDRPSPHPAPRRTPWPRNCDSVPTPGACFRQASSGSPRRSKRPSAQGPQRDPGTDHRLPRGHQRRGDHRPRDLPARPVRETWAPAGGEAAIKTNDTVGDGTTTAIVLAEAIASGHAIKDGGNPVLIKRGIDVAVARLVEHLGGVTHPLRTEDDLRRVAAISANDDETIGDAVARALYTVGDGGVSPSRTRRPRHRRRLRRGLRVRQRLRLPAHGHHVGRHHAASWTCYVSPTAHKITDVKTLMPVLDSIMRAPKPLVIVAESVEGTALQMLVHNHVNGIFQCVAIQAPGFGEKRIHLLEDMAALTGGQVHSRASSFALEQITTAHLGQADQVRVTSDHDDHRRHGAPPPASAGCPSCVPSWTGRPSARTRTSCPSGSRACPGRRR